MEDNPHVRVASSAERLAAVRQYCKGDIDGIDSQVLCLTHELHLLHHLSYFALDAVVGNAVIVCHHLEDALLGLARDAVFIA